MIEIREAKLSDVDQIRDLFMETYGEHYYYPQYYEIPALTKLVFADDTILLVAVDSANGRVAGTASVVFSIAAYNDLVGEFGRLVVRPDYRGKGIGKRLMLARIERVRTRIHVGIVENRAAHPFSQRISNGCGFVPTGFVPMKLMAEPRESIAPYVQYFCDSLSLRRNNPRVIPEVKPLAALSLSNCGLPTDSIVDDTTAPYPYDDDFEVRELQTEGYSSLLRIERGRVRNREVFGPVRLHYGMFQIQARHSNYLIAQRGKYVAGGIGFMMDQHEKAARIFELISVSDEPVRFLFTELLKRCEQEYGMEYLEVDVSAYSPRTQRTLLELGFLPVSYVPANVFHEVERLDTVRMAKVFVPFRIGDIEVYETVQPFADIVVNTFQRNAILPQIDRATRQTPILSGLNETQRRRLLAGYVLERFDAGQTIYGQGQSARELRLILEGQVTLTAGDQYVAQLSAGQCLGESSLLSDRQRRHSLTATARTPVETATVPHDTLLQLIRRHPDIGVVLYRNLAADVTAKLLAARDAANRREGVGETNCDDTIRTRSS